MAEENESGNYKLQWDNENTSIFLDVWEEHVGDLRGHLKNTHVYQRMVDDLGGKNITVTWPEVKNKIGNMTRKYRIENHKMALSGRTEYRWEHYNRVKRILSGYKPYILEECVEDSMDFKPAVEQITVSISPFDSSGESYTETPSRKRKTHDDDERWERMMKDSEKRTASIQELVSTVKEMKDLLRCIVEDNSAKNK